MLNAQLAPAMYVRKSIRKYAAEPLGPERLTFLKEALAGVTPLLPGEKFKLELGQGKEGWRVYGYCENTPLSNANLGFVLQQLDLLLFNAGLGRCWFGMGRAPGDIKAPKKLSYAMCLKVGESAEPLARAGVEEFDRKPAAELIVPGGQMENEAALPALLEPVRLAPSAMNSQPWRFFADAGRLDVLCRKPGLKKALIGRMNQIDLGIALCHLALSLEQAGLPYRVNAAAPEDKDGCYGLLSVDVNL